MSRIPIWLDCDPGHDDAFAIILAAYHPRLNLLGISSVFGNASLSYTTNNAAAILTAIGKDKEIPLYRGASKALVRPPAHAPEVHGESGLEGTKLLPKPECQARDGDAVEAMHAALMDQPKDTAWLVATGALTNVAMLLRKHPEVTAHLKGASIMGGAFGNGFSDAFLHVVDGKERVGNIGHWAEFNVLIDPEAAAEVFHNKAVAHKTTLVPLDLSHQVLATQRMRDLLLYGHDESQKTTKSTLRTMLVELLDFASGTYSQLFGLSDGYPVHDPVAVAAVLIGVTDEIPFSEWHETKSVHPKHDERFDVTVCTEGTFEEARIGTSQTGRTTFKVLKPGEQGVRIPRSVDAVKFWATVEACISRIDQVNEERGVLFWQKPPK